MTTEESRWEEKEEDKGQAPNVREILNASKIAEKPREVVLPDDGKHPSLEEAEAESVNRSPLEIALKQLFPRFKNKYIDKVAQAVMIAEIAPDGFLDLFRLTVHSVVRSMECYAEEDIDVQEVITLVYTAFSIGLSRKGRIDVHEASGSAKESAELEKLGRELGY